MSRRINGASARDVESQQHQESSADHIQMSFDMLSTVRLPPPSMNEAYTWYGPNNPMVRQPLTDNTNMLRTPESIVRLSDMGAAKRTAEFASHEPLKQRKIGNTANENTLRKPSLNVPPAMPNISGPPAWRNHYGRSFSEHEGSFERPGSDQTGPVSRFPHSPSNMLQARSMISPSASPYDRKAEMVDALHTPTRADRPASTPDISYDHRMFMLQRRMPSVPSMPMIPPIPPAPASLTTGAGMPSRPVGLGYPPKIPAYGYRNSEIYPAPYNGAGGTTVTASPIKHIEIPPPDKMPKIEDDGKKPTYSYAMLIGMAILRAPERKLTLSQIYAWIMDTFEFYRNSKPTWHNSIRHNLSLNKAFEKKVRPKGDSGKGNYWTIVSGLEYQFMKPRPAKRGSEGIVQPPTTSQAVTSNQPTIAPAIIKRPSMSLHPQALQRGPQIHDPVSASSQTHDSIPSDGTEPDERILEEESKISNSDHHILMNPNARTIPTERHESDIRPPIGSDSLPQLHTMSASSSRPHSPSIVHPNVNSSSGQLGSTNTRDTDNDTRRGAQSYRDHPHASCEQNNEWHGQGKYSFRCSTPSLLPPNAPEGYYNPNGFVNEHSFSNSVPTVAPLGLHGESNSKMQSSLNLTSKSPKRKLAELVPNTHEWKDFDMPTSNNKTEKVNSANMSNKRAHADQFPMASNIEMQMPKTPEKVPKLILDPTSTLPAQSAKLNGMPVLPPPKSIESPYAGILELSPGISFPSEYQHQHQHQQQHNGEAGSSQRPFFRRHHKKKSSLNNLADFLELDFRKSDPAGGHHRTNSNSSDEISQHQNPSNLSNGSINGNSHASGLAMSFDIELSPRVVVTPIRRPFDTPIRDQAQAYSPYCCRSASSFGSPLRRN